MPKLLKIAFVLTLVVTVFLWADSILETNYHELFSWEQHEVKPNNGLYKEYYADGKLKSEEMYVNGMKEGIWKHYYPNGNLQSVYRYEKGELHGVISHYDSLEALIFTEYFDEGDIIKREIVNDSLYKFEVAVFSHGQHVFESSCLACHESEGHRLLDKVSMTVDSTIMTDLACIEFDTVHYPLFYLDTLKVDSLRSLDPSLVVDTTLGAYDIHALRRFLEGMTKKTKLPKFPRKLKVKGRRS